MITAVSGVSGLLADGLQLGSDAHLSAFSGALFGQSFRKVKVASLGKLLKPLKLFATKLGLFGLGIDIIIGVNTFFTTGNPVPLVVSGIGFGTTAAIAFYSAPVALGFAVAYGTAGLLGVFDSSSFD